MFEPMFKKQTISELENEEQAFFIAGSIISTIKDIAGLPQNKLFGVLEELYTQPLL